MFLGKNSVTVSLDNLSEAKKMLENGVGAEEVRQKTGFFKGLDNGYRYEISDVNAKLKSTRQLIFGKNKGSAFIATDINATLNSDNTYNLSATDKKSNEKVSYRNLHINDIDDKLSYRLSSHLRQKREELMVGESINLDESYVFEGNDYLYLDEVLEHPALFEAYPELKETLVFPLHNNDKGGVYGLNINDKMVIKIGKEANLDVLLHETQHAIQALEGFSKGGDLTATKDKDITLDEINKNLKRASKVIQNNSSIRSAKLTHDTLFLSLIGKYDTLTPSLELTDEEMEALSEANDIIYELDPEAEGELWEAYSDLEQNLREEDRTVLSAYQQYRAIHGEIEAHDVMKRLSFSEDELSKLKPEIMTTSHDTTILNFNAYLRISELKKKEGHVLFNESGSFAKIILDTGSNPITVINKSSHVFLEMMVDLGDKLPESNQINKDLKTVLEWLEIDRDKWKDLTIEDKAKCYQKFADGFVNHLASNQIEKPAIRGVFKTFKRWVTAIYKGIPESPITMNVPNDVKEVFDRMIDDRNGINTDNPFQSKMINTLIEKGDLDTQLSIVNSSILDATMESMSQMSLVSRQELEKSYGIEVIKKEEATLQELNKIDKPIKEKINYPSFNLSR